MEESSVQESTQSILTYPSFTIFAQGSGHLFSTIASLEKALNKIEINKQRANTDVVQLRRMALPGRIPLMTKKEA